MSIEFAKLPWIMQKFYLTSQFPAMQYTKLKSFNDILVKVHIA